MRHRARGPQKGQPSLVCKNERWINGAHKSRHAAYVAFRAWQKGRAVVMSNQVYDRSFVARVQKMATQSASVLVEIVMKLFNPRSVVDIGCGTGSHRGTHSPWACHSRFAACIRLGGSSHTEDETALAPLTAGSVKIRA